MSEYLWEQGNSERKNGVEVRIEGLHMICFENFALAVDGRSLLG